MTGRMAGDFAMTYSLLTSPFRVDFVCWSICIGVKTSLASIAPNILCSTNKPLTILTMLLIEFQLDMVVFSSQHPWLLSRMMSIEVGYS